MLSKMLSGHLDGAAFRYLLLLSGLVDRLPWASVKEFGPFAASIYPSMQVGNSQQQWITCSSQWPHVHSSETEIEMPV